MADKRGSQPNDGADRSQTDRSFEVKRMIVGSIALCSLLLAGLIYAASPDLNNALLAASARIGIVMFAVWLALPQLRGILDRLPAVLPAVALASVALCAARPKLFQIIGSLIVVASALIAISNCIAKMTKK